MTEKEKLIKELYELLVHETDTIRYRLISRVIRFLSELEK